MIKRNQMFYGPEGSGLAAMSMPPIPPAPITQEDPTETSEEGGGGEEENQIVERPSVASAAASNAQAPATQSFTMDAGMLAKALKDAGLGQAQPVVQQPAKPLTPEERKAMLKELKRFDITPDFLKDFNNMETQASALEKFQDGLVEHLTTIMQAYVTQRDQGLSQQFAPALTFIQQYENQQMVGRFNKTYEQLSDPALQPVFNYAVGKLQQEGKTNFASESELFKAVGEEMATLIKTGNPNFTLSGSTPAKPTNGITPAPRRGGGGGGGSGNSAQPSGGPKAVSFLPPIR